jgi:hypothetical protein
MFNGGTWAYLPWATMLPRIALHWEIMLAEENWGPFAHDTIFSQRIWAHFPILVALSNHVSPRTLLIYLGNCFL